MKPARRHAFTLVELLVASAAAGLAMIAAAAAISAALRMYRLDNGDYPTTEQGLRALVERPATAPVPSNWSSEGYLPEAPTDPWGRAYVYRSPGQNGRYDLLSYGKDGEAGGEGLDADLTERTR